MLNRETSVRTGMKRLAELHPDEYYRNGGRIMPMLRLRIGRPVKPKYSLDQFSLVGHELPLSLLKPILLHGSSEVGKTAMALAHFEYPHLISNMDDLKHIGLDCDGLVFDDMNFSHLTAEECIALLDMEYERTIKCRYYNAEIPAGLPRVFTSNAPMIFPPGRTAAQQAAIDRRYTSLRSANPLKCMKLMPKHPSKHPKTSQHIPESLILVTLIFGVPRDHYGGGQAVVGSVT